MKEYEMNFTNQIYAHLSASMPNMTARKFSSYCGMSEGYFGSITAQGLEISTNALFHLAEVIDQNNKLNPSSTLNTSIEMMASEIARRMQDMPTASYVIRKQVIGALGRSYAKRELEFFAPPVLLG
jgi:hypothetical protein